jgi:hypothetical protein
MRLPLCMVAIVALCVAPVGAVGSNDSNGDVVGRGAPGSNGDAAAGGAVGSNGDAAAGGAVGSNGDAAAGGAVGSNGDAAASGAVGSNGDAAASGDRGAASAGATAGTIATGRLLLSIRKVGTDLFLPARIAVLDGEGRSHVAPESIPVAGECLEPAPETWSQAARSPRQGDSLFDRGLGARVFYLDRPAEMVLPPGTFRVYASRGFEWETRSTSVEIEADRTTELTIELSRWIDMPAEGWFSSDAHLHISRPNSDLDPLVASWMQAEGLDLAHLLQMGRYGAVVGARQYAFGEAGRYRRGSILLASGQENPRTWFLGHGIVLGAQEYLDPGEAYLDYQTVWRRARAQGALTGYAHWTPPGASIDSPAGLIDFLEVLQFDTANYTTLYRLWDMGLPIAPIAGSDFPCLGEMPGDVRFYTRVDAPFSWEGWVEGVRRGRTFVTNGPLLDLEVDGEGIGGRISLERPGPVEVRARVRFDPTRDDVRSLEILLDGRVVAVERIPVSSGRIELETRISVAQSGWIAARVIGEKLDRRPFGDRPRESLAHSGAVFVSMAAGSHGMVAAEAARSTIDEIEAVRDLVLPSRVDAFLALPEMIRGVGRTELEKSRKALLAAIDAALAWYRARLESFRAPASSEASPDSRRSPRREDAASPPPP